MTKNEADAIFARLTALGVGFVKAEYSGSGDSGQFDGFAIYDAAGVHTTDIDLDKPMGEEDLLLKVTAKLEDREHKQLTEYLESLTWDAVDEAGHDGFWNDNGGSGMWVIDVAARTIVLEHTNNVMTTEDSRYEVFNENAGVVSEEEPNDDESPAP